ncbi:MAG TPA: GAF domain-containing protein [Terriglobales bacterium]|nr:GAF domain-containing protein [Terriglobales bacterium]
MDHYSILDPGFSQSHAGMSNPAQIGLGPEVPPELPNVNALQLRPEVQKWQEPSSALNPIARDDKTGSLVDVALNDLDATLQLLAERAEYITRATGAAIALREGSEMVCRASAGPSAPALGAHLQVDAGLSGESVRTRQVLRCDDAESDPRVNRDSCRMLGIASVVVFPLVWEQEVTGLFELFSDQPYAFAERDLEALERLGDMVHTAFQHAKAARVNPSVVEAQTVSTKPELKAGTPIPAMTEQPADWKAGQSVGTGSALKSAPRIAPPEVPASATPSPSRLGTPATVPACPKAISSSDAGMASPTKNAGPPQPTSPAEPVNTLRPKASLNPEFAGIRKCESCGFPVSESRKLCLDCEARLLQAQLPTVPRSEKGGPASELTLNGQGDTVRKRLWIVENGYVVSAVVLFVMVLIAMFFSHSS